MNLSVISIPQNALSYNLSDIALTRSEALVKQGRLVSHIFTDQSGVTFRLTFFVTVVNGEVKGKLVSAERVSGGPTSRISRKMSESNFCLPISCPKVVADTAYIPAYALVVSPYTELFFFTSQPTRAPSFK